MIDAPESISRGQSEASGKRAVRHASRRGRFPPHGGLAFIAFVLAVSAALELVGLSGEAYGNTYYAAAVKSMLGNWHDFFYVSSDLGGFVSVDKPPVGL